MPASGRRKDLPQRRSVPSKACSLPLGPFASAQEMLARSGGKGSSSGKGSLSVSLDEESEELKPDPEAASSMETSVSATGSRAFCADGS